MRTLSKSVLAVSFFSVFVIPASATTGCNAAGWDLGFSDVHGCNSSYPAIKYLKDTKIVEGYSDGTYRPEDTINRAEFTKILMATKSTAEERATCVSQKNIIFSDVSRSDWFAPYVCIAKQRGVVSGYSDGTFGPGKAINYAEAAKITANTYGLPLGKTEQGDPRWYAPYSYALLMKHAVPPTVYGYTSSLTRGEMAEMIYRLETGKTSMDWFGSLPDGDAVSSDEVSTLLPHVSFSFPGSMFSAKDGTLIFPDIFSDDQWSTIPSLDLSYVRPDEDQEGCNGMAGISGYCRPSVSMPEVSVGIIDRPVEYLALGMAWRDEEPPVVVDGRTSRAFWEGIECEEMKYVFVPMDATRSLVIARTYDCNNMSETMLSSTQQDEIFQRILNSIRFNVLAAPQIAPTMEVSVLICSEDVPYNSPEADAPTLKVTRTVPKTSSVADATLRSLFRSGDLRACAGVSAIGNEYKGLTIANGVATVKLAHTFKDIFKEEQYSDLSQRYSISAQRSISANLKQFPTVKSVQYVVAP